MKQNLTRKMAIASVMAAFSVVLNLISVRTDSSLYTIYALPLLLSGIFYGPLVGLYAGLATGIIVQLFTYGISPTTILWVLAPASWGLFSGFIAYLFDYKTNKFKLLINIFACSSIALILNTLAMILDGIYYNYSYAYVFANLNLRILFAFIIAIFYFVVISVITPRLSKINSLNILKPKKEEVNTPSSNKKKIIINISVDKK